MEKSMPGDDHRRRVNRTLAVGVDGRRGSNFMAMAFVCWVVDNESRLVEGGEVPNIHFFAQTLLVSQISHDS